MATYLVAPPLHQIISVTKDCDIPLEFARVDSLTTNHPVDWEGDVSMTIELPSDDPIALPATTSGNIARLSIPGVTANLITENAKWRVVAVASGYTLPVLVGSFELHNGALS